jgi:hypothetical protein
MIAVASYKRQSYDQPSGLARLAVFVIIGGDYPSLLGGIGLVSLERWFLRLSRLLIGVGLAHNVLVLLRGVGVWCLNVWLFKAHVAH